MNDNDRNAVSIMMSIAAITISTLCIAISCASTAHAVPVPGWALVHQPGSDRLYECPVQVHYEPPVKLIEAFCTGLPTITPTGAVMTNGFDDGSWTFRWYLNGTLMGELVRCAPDAMLANWTTTQVEITCERR